MKSRFNYKEYWQIENIFLILAILFIGIMLFIMPLNRVPDEGTHASNAWETVYAPQKNSLNWRTAVSMEVSLDKDEYKEIFINKLDLSDEKFDLRISKNRIQYAPQILGMLIGKALYPSVGIIMIFGRLMNALFYILSLYFLIKYMKFGKQVLVFVALLPISIQQAASLSYDVFNFIAIAFFFSVTTNLIIDKYLSLKKILILIVSTICLYLTKLNNLSLLCILPFIGLKFPERLDMLNLKVTFFYDYLKKRKARFLLFFILFIFFIATLFLKNKGGIIHFAQIMLNSLLNNSINQTLNSVVSAGIFGFIGNFHMQLPLWLFFADISVLTLLMLGGYDENKYGWTFGKDYITVSSLIFPLQMLLVVGGMYFSWTQTVLGADAKYSTGAQGRYFTPFLIYFTPLFAYFNHAIEGKIDRNIMTKILCITLFVNFIITIYLTIIVYWYPEYQSNWLIEFVKSLD